MTELEYDVLQALQKNGIGGQYNQLDELVCMLSDAISKPVSNSFIPMPSDKANIRRRIKDILKTYHLL